ncbi:MAG: 4-hydroxy-3-methylbut-2-enyl diphosphate reductase [bacterium]
MKIEKINPHGYCGGVIKALNTTLEAINSAPKPIYMIGKVIHNDIVCNELEKQGLIIKTNEKCDAINEIENGTVIFTAHGTDEKLIDIANNKNLNVINTVCSKVSIIHRNIKKHLESHTILYIGVKSHPECEAILSISNDIILINDVNDLNLLDKSKKYYITNQTTLSLLKLNSLYDYAKNNFKDITIDNKICLATTKRQEGVLNTNADFIIVVGDKKSSNTNELYNLSKQKCDSILVSECSEITNINLSQYNNIKITSGASTPEYIVDEIIEFINKTYL